MRKILQTEILFQAHRGTIDEGIENTLPSFLHAWQFPQAIVETDIRQLADGTLVCLHDRTIRRVSTNESALLDTPIDTLAYEQVKAIDLGTNHYIPTLKEVFALMVQDRRKKLYLEIKSARLDDVLSLIQEYNVVDQILFVHAEQSFLQKLQRILPDNPRMTWCSGTPNQIVAHFEFLASTDFSGLTQIQIHWPTRSNHSYWESDLPSGFLDEALQKTQAENISLQVFPLSPTPPILSYLLEKQIRCFVTNAPASFMKLIEHVLYTIG